MFLPIEKRYFLNRVMLVFNQLSKRECNTFSFKSSVLFGLIRISQGEDLNKLQTLVSVPSPYTQYAFNDFEFIS